MRLLPAIALIVTVLVAAVLVVSGRPSTQRVPSTVASTVASGTPQSVAPPGRFLDRPSRGADGQVFPRRAGRLPLVATHPDENRHALGAAVVSPAYVSGIVLDQQVLMGDVALPWRYWLDPAVVAQVDEPTIHAAVAAWDGVPGSRWRSSFQGVQAGAAVADGRSTIFLETTCDDTTTANTYLFTDGGLGVDRHGTTATQILEADIGVCPRVTDPTTLARAIRHEVGHVAGLSHLCDPGDGCWEPGMGEGPHACRVMFWQARACQTGIGDDDRLALATLYPTLRPLTGPTAADASARASFGMLQDGAAPVVVVLQPTASAAVAAPAAVLAARQDGPLLLADTDANSCLVGVGAREVSRVLARRGTVVLVGDWPDVCERVAYDWDVRLRRVPVADPDETARRLADLGGPAEEVVLVDTQDMADAGPGAAWLAARLDVPLLPTGAVGAVGWLQDRGIDGAVQVTGLAGASVVPGVRTQTVSGLDAIDLAPQLDARLALPPGSPVVLVGAGGGVERFTAVPVAARTGAALLRAADAVEDRVLDRLTEGGPATGWVVGITDVLSPAVRAAYGSRVG